MTVEELNEAVRERIAGPDWMLWQGARYERGSCIASDKIVLAHQDHADEDIFEWMEELETQKKHKRWSHEQAEHDWDMLITDWAVNPLTPLKLFDIRSESESIFPYLILFRNQARDHDIIVDARRYRMLIDAVPVNRLYGTGPADTLVSVEVKNVEEREVETATGAIAPVTDRGGRYREIFREIAPELGL